MITGDNDQERLQELYRTDLLDSEPEESFDSITRLAVRLLDVPIAQVNLVTSHHQFAKSTAGTTDVSALGRNAPIEYSICRHAVQSGKTLNIPDTRKDQRVRDNPVVSWLQFHSYLGIPIKTIKGHVLGTLCVIDHQPRQWTRNEQDLLADLARALSSQIDIRMETARSNLRFRSLVENSSDITTLLDADGIIIYQSPPVKRILGYDEEETIGISSIDLVHPDDQSAVAQALQGLIDTPGGHVVHEHRLRTKSGNWIWVESTGCNLLDDPEIRSVLINTRDVSERKQLEETLFFQAHHDSLTGIGNRQLLLDCLEAAFAEENDKIPLTLLILDLDRFKSINDLFGHMEGDRVLEQVARRLNDAAHDASCVARLGGDEFAVLFTNQLCENAGPVARKLERAINELPIMGGQSIPVTCCIGVTARFRSESSQEELLQTADLALLTAKQSPTERIAVFGLEMREQVLDRIQIEADLRGIIDRSELTVYYQPIVYLRTGMITGVEALARWEHPTRGLIPPDEFIPLAEESGLIRVIGAEVLRKTCQEIIRWDAVGEQSFLLKVGMNISAAELTDPNLVNSIQATLQEFDIEPSRLVLEITESTAIIRSELVRRRLDELRSLGIVLAVDDFGTGYSSLAYLTRLPFDILKIDRTFIQDLGSVEANRQILLTIVNLAEHLGLDVVAEGVESAEQLEMLQSLNFAFLQGYYVARPMPAADFLDYYNRNAYTGVLPPWPAV